tara:strand:+ start:3755 stop:4198 length:444 start_codon:yes stop_codon:yes gene_type:complete
MRPETDKLVEKFIELHGESALINRLTPEMNDGSVLTIISNAGVHPYHDLHKRGEVFIASEGNIDFSSEEAAIREIEKILILVSKKLKEKRWKRVYLVPFGPAPLSLQIKSLVQKILDIETIDVLHIGNGQHIDLKLDPRKIAIKSSE